MKYSIIKLQVHGNHDGKLVALEKNDDFPFEIRRVYYIWDTAHDVIRGKHAHRHLQQVIICLRGECDFIIDDGTTRDTIHLDKPTEGLYLNNNVWREFSNFSKDCIVLVLASEHYIPTDYIHDYSEFLKLVKNK